MTMQNPGTPASGGPASAGPPSKHQLALMIWLAVSRPSPSSTSPSTAGSTP